MKRAHKWRRNWVLAISFFALRCSLPTATGSWPRRNLENQLLHRLDAQKLPSTAIGASCRLIPYIPWRQIAFFLLSPLSPIAAAHWNKPLEPPAKSRSGQLPFALETAFSSVQKLHLQRKPAGCRHDARETSCNGQALVVTWMTWMLGNLGCPMVWQVYLRAGWFCCSELL